MAGTWSIISTLTIRSLKALPVREVNIVTEAQPPSFHQIAAASQLGRCVAKSRARQAWIGGPFDERKKHRRRKPAASPARSASSGGPARSSPCCEQAWPRGFGETALATATTVEKKDMPGRLIPGADRGRGVASFGAERRQKGAVSEARGTVVHFFCRVSATWEGRWNGGEGEEGKGGRCLCRTRPPPWISLRHFWRRWSLAAKHVGSPVWKRLDLQELLSGAASEA